MRRARWRRCSSTKLYGELLRLSLDAQQVIVVGDLNEALTPLDRLPGAATAAGPPRPLAAALSPIRCLLQQGFANVYRHLHPLEPGFTHCVAGARPVQSRLDYIWCKGHSLASFAAHSHAPDSDLIVPSHSVCASCPSLSARII